MQKTLPKGWKWVKLGEVAQIVSGSTPRTDEPRYWNGDILWITPADLSKLDTIEIHDTARQITKDGYKSCSTTMLPPGTVLLSSRAPIGHLAVAGKKMCTNQGFKSLIPNQSIHSYYLYFVLKRFKDKLISLGSGATFTEISKTSVERFEIPLPPLPTQHKIVEILEEADNLRKLRKQADEKMKDLIPSIFVQMFGDPATNPKGWEMKKLGEVSNIRRGASPRPMGDPRYFGGAIPWIRISDIHKNGKFLNDTEDHVTENGAKRSVYLKAGSLIMAMAASIGTPCFLAVDGCIHDGFVVFEKLSPKLDKEFLYYFLISFKDRFVSLAPEGTQKNLNTALIKSVLLPLPPPPLQQEFAKLVEDIEAEKARQTESRKKLDELFNSLMQRAFIGELMS